MNLFIWQKVTPNCLGVICANLKFYCLQGLFVMKESFTPHRLAKMDNQC